jgi:hypothetical protein
MFCQGFTKTALNKKAAKLFGGMLEALGKNTPQNINALARRIRKARGMNPYDWTFDITHAGKATRQKSPRDRTAFRVGMHGSNSKSSRMYGLPTGLDYNTKVDNQYGSLGSPNLSYHQDGLKETMEKLTRIKKGKGPSDW